MSNKGAFIDAIKHINKELFENIKVSLEKDIENQKKLEQFNKEMQEIIDEE